MDTLQIHRASGNAGSVSPIKAPLPKDAEGPGEPERPFLGSCAKQLKLSYHNSETVLSPKYPYDGNVV